jgi:hypothetical protein
MHPYTGEVWQHYKTKGEYEILFIGKMQMKDPSLDMKECVVYKSLEDGGVWVRPLSDFIEEVITDGGERVERFTKIR